MKKLAIIAAGFCVTAFAAGDSFTNDLAYLKSKWRTDVTDEGTGLGTDGVLDGWREIVASRGDEPWETTKAKLFAFGCDRTAIGVSPHDWFPAFAPWSFHRGHPLLRKILPPRAAEVDGAHSPGLREKIAAGTKIGRWVVWKDYSHCAPDWDYILPLGFPGMRDRLLANWKDTPYYHSRRIAADAALRLVGRLAEHARRANEASPSKRLAAEAAALARLRDGAPRTAYEVMLFIYLEWVMGENFDGFQVRTLSNLDRILTPYYRADLAAGRTTEAEFRDQLRHFWWQWGSIDNYFGQPVYFGGTKADGTTEYNEVSRIMLEEHDQLGLPTPKVHIKTGPSTPDWVWRKTLDLARRQRSVTFCGEEPIARAITGLGYTAEQARTCAIWGCYEWGIRDSCNDTIPSYVSALKPVETLLEKCRKNRNSQFTTFNSFKAEYLRLFEETTREARELAFETEKWTHEVNPSMLFSLSVEYSVKTGRDAYHDGTAHGNNTHILLVGLGSAVDSLLAVEDIVFKDRVLSLSELGDAMAANWKGHEELRLRMLRSKRKWGNNVPEANALGRDIAHSFARQANNIPNSRGGRFVTGGHSSRRFVDFGKLTGATPDGRLAGEEMSKNLSPAPGADTEGVTALINTVTAIDPADLPMDLPLDVMLHPSAVAGDKGLDVMRVLVEQYHAKGFTLIQFNVFDADMLRDAQAHPERYENLQVRVCGWNVRWNDLPREQQDAYIRRADPMTHEIGGGACRPAAESSGCGIALAAAGATEYSIVVRANQPRGEKFVVDDFRALMKRATGVEFPVVDAAKAVRGRRIVIGIAPDGAGDEKLGEQEWRVVMTADGDLHLYGGGDNGARLAVYDFLQNVLGFRFFDMHGGVKVPDLRTCRVPSQNRRRKPSFRFRYLNGESGMFNRPESSLFLFRNGQNSWSGRDLKRDGIEVPHDEFDFLPPHAHSLRYYLPADSKEPTFPWIKEQGGPDLKTAHPEYFTADAKGARVFNHQYCLSNSGLRALLAERILENMRRNPERTVFDVSAGDTPGAFCYCEGCKALTAKYGTPAGPLVDFVLEFCPRAEREHPGKIVMCLAYRKMQTQPPPKGIDRMPANFMPDFAPIDDNFAKDWNDPSNAQSYEDLKGWGRLCSNVMVWYYTNPYSGPLTPPLGNVERGVVDIKLMAEAGVTAHIWEHNVGVAWGLGFTELQSYVYANLMMDVTKDWRALADEFIDFEYGAAADEFRRYWGELENLRKTEHLHLAWNARESTYRHLTPERMIRWDADFDAMERAVAVDPDRLFAIRRVRANLDYAMLNRYRDMKKAGIGLSAAKLAERVMDTAKRVADAFCAKRLEGRKKVFLKSVDDSVSTAKMLYSGEAKPLPQELFGGIPEDRLFISIPKVNGASYESDPDAAFGCRAVYTNNKKGAKLPLHASFEDVAGKHYNFKIARVTREDLPPRGKYKFYAMGGGVLSLDSVFRIGVDDWWDFKTALGLAYEFGSYNRAKFYASLKFEGPEFYPEDEGKPNRVFCDRVVVVRE